MNYDEWQRFFTSQDKAAAQNPYKMGAYYQAHQECVNAIRHAFQNDAGGLAMCGTQRPGGSGIVPFVCTRLSAHSGPHMAMTLQGQTQAIWADAAATAFEEVARKIICFPRLSISNGSLVVGGEW